jgi:type VI secretion system secreted protein Hcp
MPITGYLKIDDIPGESQRVDHEDEIDIHDMKWGLERTTSSPIGRGRVRARTDMKPLTLYKYYDAASPYLVRAVHKGQSFPEAVFYVRKDSGEAHLDYLVITMENVVVSSYEVASNREDMSDMQLEEQIELEFENITIKYTVQEADHSAGDVHEIALRF